MKTLEEILIEQAQNGFNTYGRYAITAADIRAAAKSEFLPITKADFGIRLIRRSKS
jgi:hypothetical protein